MKPITFGRFLSHPCSLVLALAGARAALAQSSGVVLEYPNPTVVQRLPESALRLTLGGSDGVEFHRVVTILPLTRGGFVVVNGGTSELRFFDESGRLRSTVGRSGRGPGEYVGIRDAGLLPGDTLVVFDPGARRISILNPDGGFARSFPLQAPFDGGGSATRMVALRNGTVMVGYSEIRQMAPQPTPTYFGQRLFAYSTMGQLRSPNGVSLPESEHFVQVTTPERGGVAYWDLAFGRVMSVRADSTSLLVGDGSDWTIQLRSADGAVLRTHRLRRATVPVSASDKDAYRAAALAGSQGPERVIAEKMVAEMPYPKTKPSFRRLESDGSGRIWIETYPEVGQTESVWIRFAPSTRTTVALAFPARFRPLAFTAHLAYGVWRNADDVEHVRLYSLDGF
jgi:hypothetical protein